jgi:hypothetical protein
MCSGRCGRFLNLLSRARLDRSLRSTCKKIARPWLDLLLRYIYPYPNPELTSLHQIRLLWPVADKFFLEGLKDILRAALLSERILKDPVGVYLFACQYRMAKETKVSSRRALKIDLRHIQPPTDDAGLKLHFYRLVKLHQDRAVKATDILEAFVPQHGTMVCVECDKRRTEIYKTHERITKELQESHKKIHGFSETKHDYRFYQHEPGQPPDESEYLEFLDSQTTKSDLPLWWEPFLNNARSELAKSPAWLNMNSEMVQECIRKSCCVQCRVSVDSWKWAIKGLR